MQVAYEWKGSLSEEKRLRDRKVTQNGQKRDQEKHDINIKTEKRTRLEQGQG